MAHFKVAIKSVLCFFTDLLETESMGRSKGVIVHEINIQ